MEKDLTIRTIDKQLDKLVFNPVKRNGVKLYYDENTGNIVAASVTENKEFKEYTVKDVSWEEGKGFLSGHKSPDQYFINIESIRREVVKKNLVQIAGSGSNFDYFDMLDFTIADKESADIVITFVDGTLEIVTTKELFPMYLTMQKLPLMLLETIEYTGKKSYKYDVNVPVSLYADMKYFRTLTVYYEKPH